MDEVFVCVMFEGESTEPAFLRQLLEMLSELEPLAPNYWAPHERKRLAWDIEDIIAYVQSDKATYGFLASAVQLARTRAPKYTGDVVAGDRTVNSFTFTFSPAPSPKQLPLIYEATERLVHRLSTVFAYVHPIWRKGPDVEGFPRVRVSEYVYSGLGSDQSLYESGIPSVFARTWFGPQLVERVGRELLLSVDGTHEEEVGRVRLDLAPEPWNATFKELAPRKEEVLRELKPSGMFMDVQCDDSGGFTKQDPAPKWTRPDWIMGALAWRAKKAERA